GCYRVVEEDRVDRLTDRLIASEGEADVRHAPADEGARQLRLDPPRRLDVRDGVVRMGLDTGRDREDVRVEDDLLGRKAGLLGEDLERAPGDRHLSIDRVGLTLLVERHDDDGRAVPPDEA